MVDHRTVDRGAPPVWSRPLGACIGSGGFASVWEIAGGGVLKVAHASHDLARARLVREAEALAVIGAPAVPELIASGVLSDGRAWIAMERISGTNLGDLIAAGPIAVADVVGLSLRILDALGQIHAAGFAHRDLKPDNIVVRSDGSSVILDLGLARRIPADPDDPNRAGVQVGSVEYMAPEQLLDATTAGVPADLYAFGCILYELAAGRPPFVGDSATLERAHAALRPPPLGALANVPGVVEQICDACLAKLPARRPSSAIAVATRLREAGAVLPQRVQHSRSVITEGTQPVVLLWAELPRVDRALLSTLAARKITIISQRGRRVLGGVVGAEHADPAGAALAAARDLAAAGARVALHLDALIVKPSADGVVLAGASVERPEDWMPPAAWTGVVMTRALAAVTQIPTRPADVGDGFMTFGEVGKTTELFGRAGVLAELVDDAAAALAGTGPALTLVVGDPGVGKTAVATSLVPRLVELGVRVHAGQVPPPGSHQPVHSVVAGLIGAPVGPTVRAIGDAIRAAARERPTAIILDDLHLAGHELLDALEYATLGGEAMPLWIIGLASPRLDQRRPGFGARAERHRRHVLAPLDDDAVLAMTAALLRPAEYPPLRALRQIASIARGNPMHLVTLAREVHDRGAIRTRPNGEHFLDTSTLDALPPIALGPWLAVRELASLSVELVALARVCAVLGEELDRDELTAVIDLVERRGGATTTVDVDVGLRELESQGILRSGSGRWAFRQALVEEGIYATTNEADRRDLHAAALEYWQTMVATDSAVAVRVARHAEAVGERRIAAAAYAVVGRDAHDHHRSLDADQAWHGAVRNLDDRDLTRGRALLGRARARYRLQRMRDALADLDEALAIAVELADPELEIEALLERATALDWSDDYAGSAAVAAAARARQASVELPAVAAEVALAEARAVFRERFAAAVPFLETVVELARAAGHRETEIVAAVMLAPALVENRRLDEAERVFAALIERCEASGDLLHLGAAYANRTFLWAARGETERVAADLSTVIQLAREAGQATLEHIATYNLAEDRLWEGLLDEAAQLARRSLAIQRGHGEGALWPDHLLLSRIYAAKGDRVELRRSLAELAGVELGDADRVVVGVLECAATSVPREAWVEPLRQTGRQLDPELVNLRLELASLANDHDALPAEMRPELQALARTNPIWSKRRIF